MADNPEIWKAAAMADHFEKIQKLPEPVPGVPNFRRVPGYKVFKNQGRGCIVKLVLGPSINPDRLLV